MTDDEKWLRAAVVALYERMPTDVRDEVMRGMDPLNRGRVLRAVAEHETRRDGSDRP